MEEYSLCFAFWILFQRCLLTLLSITKSSILNPKSAILLYALCPMLSVESRKNFVFFYTDSNILPILLAPFLL